MEEQTDTGSGDTSVDGDLFSLTHTHGLSSLQTASWWRSPAAWIFPPQLEPLPPAAPQLWLQAGCPGRSAAWGSSRCWSRAPRLGWSGRKTGGIRGGGSVDFKPFCVNRGFGFSRAFSDRWHPPPQSQQPLCPHHTQDHSQHPHSAGTSADIGQWWVSDGSVRVHRWWCNHVTTLISSTPTQAERCSAGSADESWPDPEAGTAEWNKSHSTSHTWRPWWRGEPEVEEGETPSDSDD